MTMTNTMVKATSSTAEVDIYDSSIRNPIPKDWRPMISSYDDRESDSSNQKVNGWISLIKDELYVIPSIEDIYIDIEGSEVDVWVVIPEYDLSILHKVVEIEGALFDTLVSGENPPFLIEFHVIYSHGRHIEEFAPTRAIKLPR